MGNTQPTKKENGKEKVTLDALPKSPRLENMVDSVSKSLPKSTTATMSTALQRTWTSAELEELQRKAGLVAGALADLQTAGCLVAVRRIEYAPNTHAVKLYFAASGIDFDVIQTSDGLDFSLVAVDEK